MTPSRRTLLGGLLATLAAPAIIRTPGLLMPVRSITPVADAIERAWLRGETLEGRTFHVERSLTLVFDGFPVMRNCDLFFPKFSESMVNVRSTLVGHGTITGCNFSSASLRLCVDEADLVGAA